MNNIVAGMSLIVGGWFLNRGADKYSADEEDYPPANPLRIIIGGPPHSGKSTLMNLLEDKFQEYGVSVELRDLDLASKTDLKGGFDINREKKDWTPELAEEAANLFGEPSDGRVILGDSIGLVSQLNEIVSEPADVAILLVGGSYGKSDEEYRSQLSKWDRYYESIDKPVLMVIRSSMNPNDENYFDPADNYGVIVGLDRPTYQEREEEGKRKGERKISLENACLEGMVFEIAQAYDLRLSNDITPAHKENIKRVWPSIQSHRGKPQNPVFAKIENRYYEEKGWSAEFGADTENDTNLQFRDVSELMEIDCPFCSVDELVLNHLGYYHLPNWSLREKYNWTIKCRNCHEEWNKGGISRHRMGLEGWAKGEYNGAESFNAMSVQEKVNSRFHRAQKMAMQRFVDNPENAPIILRWVAFQLLGPYEIGKDRYENTSIIPLNVYYTDGAGKTYSHIRSSVYPTYAYRELETQGKIEPRHDAPGYAKYKDQFGYDALWVWSWKDENGEKHRGGCRVGDGGQSLIPYVLEGFIKLPPYITHEIPAILELRRKYSRKTLTAIRKGQKMQLDLDKEALARGQEGAEDIAQIMLGVKKMSSFKAESFNAKIAPALESYTKDELISSMAGPQGSASYDEMVYDPVSQSRLSAEENR